MKFDISPAWLKTQGMINGLIALLPNLVLALVVFAFFVLRARWAKALFQGFCRRHKHQHNLGLGSSRITA